MADPIFPSPDFVRAGPPIDVRDLDRARSEKWSKVMVVVPEARPGEEGHAFLERGPYTLPLATRADDVDAGSKDAWRFFTHPYTVFPSDSVFYNVKGPGVLESRLSLRTEEGVQLFDEVGAGFDEAEMVLASYPAALGVLRHRALGQKELSLPYATDMIGLDLDLLELFRLSTLLLHTENPLETVMQLDRLYRDPTIQRFARGCFDEGDQAAMGAILSEQGATQEQVSRFRVSEDDLCKVVDIRDGKGRYAIQELLTEWESFHQQHGQRLEEIDHEMAQSEANLAAIRERVLAIQDAAAKTKSRMSRFFSRHDRQLKELKAEAVHNLRTMRALEADVQAIPGYERLRGLSDTVQGVQESIGRIYRMARDLFDHNVSQTQLRSLRNIYREKVLQVEDPEQRVKGFRNYDLRLRAEILNKVLTTYSLSAYVLRRPDAVAVGSPSWRNLQRVNRLAGRLIEYFSYVRYGTKTLGQAYDETWGQVVNIEKQL